MDLLDHNEFEFYFHLCLNIVEVSHWVIVRTCNHEIDGVTIIPLMEFEICS